MARYDELGREVPDPRPVEWPTGLSRPLSIHEEMRRFIRQEMSRQAADNDMETFEEADDFDVPGEEDEAPLGAYVVHEMTPEARDGKDSSPPGPPAKQAVDPIPDSGKGSSMPDEASPPPPPAVDSSKA